MTRVYAFASHRYAHTDEKGVQVAYGFNAGEWREVPDDVAVVVCSAHPQKLVCLKPGEDRPGEAEPVVEAAEPAVAEPPKPSKWFRSARKGR